MLAAVTGWSIRRPVIIVVVWLALVVAGFAVGVRVFDRLVSDVGTVPASESDRAWSLAAQAGPEPVVLTAVVYGRPAGDPARQAATTSAVTDLRRLPGIARVSDPLPSTDGEALLLTVTLTPDAGVERAAHAAAQRLRHIDTARVVVAGGPLTGDEFNAQAQSDVQRAELLSTPVVLLLLLVVFGGLRAAGLPLLIAAAGVGGTFAILYTISLLSDVSVYAIQVATMLSVGLAVDYGLLMVSRFREEHATHPALADAVARTAMTAGRTVAYSGLTVAAVLAGLLVFPDPFLHSMGLAGMAVVAVVVAAALTLLPALLVLVGGRIAPARPATGTGVFAGIARTVQRRPLLVAVAATGVMLAIALPVSDLRLGQVDARLLPASTQTRQLYDVIAAHYPQLNRPNPIVIVAAAPADSPELAGLRERVAALPHISTVEVLRSGPVTVLHAAVDQPAHTGAARRTVAAIRAIPAPFEVDVTGDAAMLVDYQAMLTDRLPWAVGVVMLGTLMLLFLFTGSVLLPVKAVATNLLSIGAALGAVVWVFQQGHLAGWFATTRLDATHLSVPVLVGAIAFGLSVDYEVFLLSRIRERWLTDASVGQAVADGLQHTGRIITSAALLLGVVFAGFLVAGFVPVKAIGLGLVLAVGLDATIVRLLLVPATMTVLGRYNWWAPDPLRRLHDRLTGVPRSCPVPATRRSRAPLRLIRRRLSAQAATPHGLPGRLLARIWLRETATVNDIAIDLLAPAAGERMLEIGFGPGRTLAKLATAGAHVTGVDVSPTMLTTATRRNRAHIAAGRVRLHLGDGGTLPVPDDSLDGALSVHSVYFWADPPTTLAEIARALRPCGRLVLAFRPGDHPWPPRFDPDSYRLPTIADVSRWLDAAGFTDIRQERRDPAPTTVWLVATNRRADPAPR
jgi:RND superfamily putative drug exporter